MNAIKYIEAQKSAELSTLDRLYESQMDTLRATHETQLTMLANAYQTAKADILKRYTAEQIPQPLVMEIEE